jgi:hypothetical protein
MTGVIGLKNSKSNMSNRHSIAIILGLGGVVAYFLLIAFCLGESLPEGIADNPTVKGKGKDGECYCSNENLSGHGCHRRGQVLHLRPRG